LTSAVTGQPRSQLDQRVAGHPRHLPQQLRLQPEGPLRATQQPEHPAAEHLQLGGDLLALQAAGRRGHHPPLRGRVHQGGQDLHPRRPVDRRVVQLGHDGDPAALEPVDHVELPQRPRPVQRAGGQPGDLLGQLLVGAGGRDRDLPDVEVEVEVRVVGPVRHVDPQRHLHQAPAQRGQQVQPLLEELSHSVGGERLGHLRGVDDQ
jgi:hypothetical protein